MSKELLGVPFGVVGDTLLVLAAFLPDDSPNVVASSGELSPVGLDIRLVSVLHEKVMGFCLFADQFPGLVVDGISVLVGPRRLARGSVGRNVLVAC